MAGGELVGAAGAVLVNEEEEGGGTAAAYGVRGSSWT